MHTQRKSNNLRTADMLQYIFSQNFTAESTRCYLIKKSKRKEDEIRCIKATNFNNARKTKSYVQELPIYIHIIWGLC